MSVVASWLVAAHAAPQITASSLQPRVQPRVHQVTNETIALVAAGTQQPFLAGIALSGLLLTAHTCTLPSGKRIQDMCPKVDLQQTAWRLDVPANASWLFYGTSYMSEIYATVVAANQESIARIENLADPEFARELHPDIADMSCERALVASTGCNVVGARQNCTNMPLGVSRVTLKNGAVLVGMHNFEPLQAESAEGSERLSDVLRRLDIQHAFYMHPHDFVGGSFGFPGYVCMDSGMDPPPPLQEEVMRKPRLEEMCTAGNGEEFDSEEHWQCVEQSILWTAVKASVAEATLVAPPNVVLGSSQRSGSGVYYTRSQTDLLQCSASDCRTTPGCVGMVELPYKHRHQCIVVHDQKRDVYAGGPVLAMAQDLLDLVR